MNGKIPTCTAEASTPGKTVESMKGSTSTTRNTASGVTSGPMVGNMWGHGPMGSKKVRGNISYQMGKSAREFGKMEKGPVGRMAPRPPLEAKIYDCLLSNGGVDSLIILNYKKNFNMNEMKA